MHKWVKIQISIMHVTDIPQQWLSIPDYLHKRFKSMHIKVIVIEISFCFAKISHMKDFVSIMFLLLRTLLAEICSEK